MGNKTITISERRKIFALYLHTNIGIDIRIGSKPFIVDGSFIDNTDTFSCLLVKPLSAITDMHAGIVGEILGFKNDQIINGKAFCKQIEKNERMTFNFHPLNTLECFDYLRSRRYALPYRNLTVEDLITAKVFQLTN